MYVSWFSARCNLKISLFVLPAWPSWVCWLTSVVNIWTKKNIFAVWTKWKSGSTSLLRFINCFVMLLPQWDRESQIKTRLLKQCCLWEKLSYWEPMSPFAVTGQSGTCAPSPSSGLGRSLSWPPQPPSSITASCSARQWPNCFILCSAFLL